MITLINSVEHLKELSEEKQLDCFIQFNGGFVSSKYVVFYPDEDGGFFEVHNCIDDTQQTLLEKDLYTHSNIGEAIEKHSFFARL